LQLTTQRLDEVRLVGLPERRGYEVEYLPVIGSRFCPDQDTGLFLPLSH